MRDQAIPAKRSNTEPLTPWSILSWAGWVIVGVAFMLAPSSFLVAILAWLAFLVSSVLILKAPLPGLYLLPLPMMIGPVLNISLAGVGNATIGDLYSVLLILRVLAPRVGRFNIAAHPLLVVCAVWLGFSALLSLDLGASAAGILKISQFALLIGVSRTLVRSTSDLHTIFLSWVLVTTFCSVMSLWFLFSGQPLFLLNWSSDLNAVSPDDVEGFDTFYRLSTFFYTNIFLPLGLSLLYAITILMREKDAPKAVLLWLSIPVNAAALILNNTRSMLIPVAFLGGAIVAISFWKTLTSKSKSAVLSIVVLFVVGAGFIGLTLLISESQLFAWQERLGDISSTEMRLSVWGGLISKLLDEPLRLLLVGWGPQATTRQGGGPIQYFLTGSLGNIEGAFDNTLLGFLFEYGAILSAVVLAFIGTWFSRMWIFWRSTADTLFLVLLIMGTAVLMQSLFQQFVVSPPALLVLQVFTLIPVSRGPRWKAIFSRAGSAI
jgi:hypothetical protein